MMGTLKIRLVQAIAGMVTAVMAAGTRCAADSVVLKSSVRSPVDGADLLLTDIADLEGPEAVRLGRTVILKATDWSSAVQVRVEEVQAALDTVGAPWGKLNLNGETVTIRPRRTGNSMPPMAMKPASIPVDGQAMPAERNRGQEDAGMGIAAADAMQSQTLRGAIARMVVNQLRMGAGEVRLSFDAGDEAMLSRMPGEDSFEIQPLGALTGDRAELAVRVWREGEVVERASMSVRIDVQVRVARAVRDLGRDHVIATSDVEPASTWVPAGQRAHMLESDSATGRIVHKAVRAGEVLREGMVREQTLISRGEAAMVRCIVGGVVISMQAIAETDGVKDSVIEFHKPGERQVFMARVTGRAEAVVDLSGEGEGRRSGASCAAVEAGRGDSAKEFQK